MIHNPRQPLECCPRCRQAELAGRARRRPEFSYDRLQAPARPPETAAASHRIFHGQLHVATLRPSSQPGRIAYDVVLGDADGEELRAESLHDAVALAEETYTTAWRAGRHAWRGPVRDLWIPARTMAPASSSRGESTADLGDRSSS